MTMTELLTFSRPAMASTLAEVGLMLAEAKVLLAKLPPVSEELPPG